MTLTQRLLKIQAQGRTIVVSGGSIDDNSLTGEWPVEYKPRCKTDPRPWVAKGTLLRYSGGECKVQERFYAYRVSEGHWLVCDLVADIELTNFRSRDALLKSRIYAAELSLKDRDALMGRSSVRAV